MYQNTTTTLAISAAPEGQQRKVLLGAQLTPAAITTAQCEYFESMLTAVNAHITNSAMSSSGPSSPLQQLNAPSFHFFPNLATTGSNAAF
jgi:hypothetical protein